MRNVIGTLRPTSSGAQQFIVSEQPLVTAVTLKARSSNTGQVYIGHSSAVTSSNGFCLDASDAWEATYTPGGVKGTSFWMVATDTAQWCDYAFIMEN